MEDIMVDLETLGKRSNSVILAIGAVEFDETGIGNTFYVNVDPQSCVDRGMEIDVSTVMWWMRQSEEARQALMKDGIGIYNALVQFADYVGGGTADRHGSVKVWGNGSPFDNVILGNAYDKCNLLRPWEFWNDRCYRTMKNQYPHIKFMKSGVAHNALDDAVSQALHMSKILAYIKAIRGGNLNAEVQ